jgi:hypothetical protein
MQPDEKAELVNFTDEDNAVYILHFIRMGPDGEILPTRSVWFSRINLHLARQTCLRPGGQHSDGRPLQRLAELRWRALPQDHRYRPPARRICRGPDVVKMEINRGVSDDKFVLEQPEGTQLQVLGQPAPRRRRAPPLRQRKEEETVTVKLVLENLKHKPMRSLLSMFLIAVPVTLILCLVGLSQGMLADSARRARGIGADIMVRPPKTSVLTLSGAPLPEKLVDAIQQKPHVALAIGMIVHLVTSVTYVNGIDLDGFNR